MSQIVESTEIVIKDGQFVRRNVTEQSLGQQDAVLQQFVESSALMLLNFMPFGDSTMHMLVSKNTLVMITELKKLPFVAWWVPSARDHNKLQMQWIPSRGSVKIDDPWPIPAGWGRCLFVLRCNRSPDGRTQPQNCYLLLYRDKELYNLPYPNVYGDTRICMGREWDNKKSLGKDLMSDMIHAHTSFHATSMNSDLVSPMTHSVFQRNWDGWVVPSETVFRTSIPVAAPAYMQGFAL